MAVSVITEKQLEDMANIWNKYAQFKFTSIDPITKERLNDWREEEDNIEYYGIGEGTELYAFLTLRDEKEEVYIDQIAVDTEHKFKGYGRELLDFALQNAAGKEVKAKISCKNIDAINFSFRNGFEIIELIEDDSMYLMEFVG